MARIPCNGVELEYEWVGPPEGAPLLLVPGHEGQLIWWHEGLCEQLVAHGFRLLRYDNRDSGLSTHMDDRPAPDLRAAAEGDHSSLPYTLADLADDAAALLQALGWTRRTCSAM